MIELDSEKQLSIEEIARILIKENNRPMTIKEITQKVLERKTLTTKTPHSSVSASLQRSSLFKRVGKGTYDLN